MNIDWESVLKKLQSPGKYTGTEWNSYRYKKGAKRFLLCFPDDYVIGMSSLGFHTVAQIVNSSQGFSCERCFAPGVDMEKWMRENNVELFSLETKTPVRAFDIIGFSFHYELSYTNFINMLDLSGIEVFREKRQQDDPVLIGGGPTCVNPAILSEFLDLIVVGEAEAVLPDLLEIFSSNPVKKDFLEKAALVKGVYVPGINKSVELAVFTDFDNRFYPVEPPVAIVDIPHNRLNIEINRGCRGNCHFCQARVIYGPYREKTKEQIMEISRKSICSTGYDEMVLTSLSATDHPGLIDIIDELHSAFRDLGVSVVMSSMRVKKFLGELPDKLLRLKKSGLTFAPETASEKLKKVINKNVSNADIVEAARIASKKGWKKIKLYFMVGLPGETMADIEEIVNLVHRVRDESSISVNITVLPLTPQPHTPFQWVRSVDPETLEKKVAYIRKKISANVKSFKAGQYIIENILARADKTLGEVVVNAWRIGSRFDQWGDYFDFKIWEKAFEESNIDWKDYYYRDFDEMEQFPWDVVRTGTDRSLLRKYYE